MSQNHHQPRPIRRLLVANRGEIATRIISAARELDIETYAIYTENDVSHTYHATHAIKLSSPASYLDIDALISVARDHDIDAVHPGYGFLSESAEFASRMSAEGGAMVIGPGHEILAQTGDKLMARRLAEQCSVVSLPALTEPTSDVEKVREFSRRAGYPIMIKAVDGGGGRGIRLVSREGELAAAMTRAVEESPSKQVFAEKAAVGGFRHVEVQIVGDCRGNVIHLWERECSIQRRYQKVVEMAPSSVKDRRLIAAVVDAALRMARKIRYTSLGTFEFLVNPETSEFYFLEINPRLQVEHTVTESICFTDIVKAQLELAQGATISETDLQRLSNGNSAEPPALVGKIQSFHFPSGNGVRVDTNLVNGATAVVSADFDSLIAKLIVTANDWGSVIQKAKRALDDTRIEGTKTNLAVLLAGAETNGAARHRQQTTSKSKDRASRAICPQPSSSAMNLASASSTVLFRKDDAWSLTLTPKPSPSTPNPSSTATKTATAPSPSPYHLQLTRVLRNDFPTSLSAELTFTTPSSSSPQAYVLHASSTSASASSLTSQHRQGSASDPSHVTVPFSGKLVEVLVDVGDQVRKGDVVCVIKQMKMELEVRTARAGRVTWVTEAEDGEDVAEGLLAAVVVEERVEAKL
ncbi:hypothetical protein H2203_007049 [Taxawa tesnikishii (nom. ined.)]|nr:hypothetical protein H2203_007049 [Dothideales sp. JES 119]